MEELGFLERLNMDLVNKVQAEKEAILIKRISERVPADFLPLDIVKESKRTFPRIACVKSVDMKSEHWYWNDGSEKGLHIVSFIHEEQPFNFNDSIHNLKFEIKFKVE